MQKNKILVLCLLAAMCGLLASGGISIETLLEYTPQEPEKAFFLFLFLYALKSATIFFPLIFLEVASGYLFPTALDCTLAEFYRHPAHSDYPILDGKSPRIGNRSKSSTEVPQFTDLLDLRSADGHTVCPFSRSVLCVPEKFQQKFFHGRPKKRR